jgi:hypothetical protein
MRRTARTARLDKSFVAGVVAVCVAVGAAFAVIGEQCAALDRAHFRTGRHRLNRT